jgi:hypothetical protein
VELVGGKFPRALLEAWRAKGDAESDAKQPGAGLPSEQDVRRWGRAAQVLPSAASAHAKAATVFVNPVPGSTLGTLGNG